MTIKQGILVILMVTGMVWLALMAPQAAAGVEETQYHTTEAARGVKFVERAILQGATQFTFTAAPMPGSKYNDLPGVREPEAVPDWEWVTVYSLRLPDGQ